MALNALKHCARLTSGQAGRVHSVFTHACNLLMPNGELWVVQTREMPLAPNGIIVDIDDLRLRFIAGTSVACLPRGGDVSMLGSTPVSTQLISAGNAANLHYPFSSQDNRALAFDWPCKKSLRWLMSINALPAG